MTIPIEKMLNTLAATYDFHPMDDLTRHNPYKVLIACILSLRTKDEVTIPASERLFARADTPAKMVRLSAKEIQKLIFPTGFYITKSQTILDISERLLNEFDGKVPNTMEALLTFKGVGRKTANLVLGLGFQIPAVCVDTHVHRISNRFGYVKTKTPEETELALRKKLHQKYWPIINKVMVLHGQKICKPIGARCDICPIENSCNKLDVKARKTPVSSPSSKKTPHKKA